MAAFGKDPAVLKAAGSMRQRVAAHDAKLKAQRTSSGGGGGRHFGMRFQPSVDDIDTIRLVLANYPNQIAVGDRNNAVVEVAEYPYFRTEEHYDGQTRKSCFCSAGPFAGNRAKAEACRGCEIFWDDFNASGGDKEKRKHARMSKRGIYNYTVVHQRPYHKMPQTDIQGNVRSNPTTGVAYYEWVPCIGRGCEACRIGAETKPGDTRYWPLGSGHHAALTDVDKLIGKDCSGCGNKECIESVAWICGNPNCGDAVIDMRTSNLSDKDIDDISLQPHHCRTCGQTELLLEIVTCNVCSSRGGTATRATLFDVDLKVHRVADPNGGKQTTLQVTGWSQPRPIDPMYASLYVPLDLPKLLAPTPYDDQVRLFGAPQAARQPVTAANASRAYAPQEPGLPSTPVPNPYAANPQAGAPLTYGAYTRPPTTR